MKLSPALFSVALVNATQLCFAKESLWDKYERAPVSDGKIRLRTVWVRSAPAHDILSESGLVRVSDKKGYTYEFYVLVENVGKEEIEVPSIIDRTPRSIGMPVGTAMIVPYI